MSNYKDVVNLWQSWKIKTAEDLSNRLKCTYVQSIHESNTIDSSPVSANHARDVIVFGTVANYTGSLLVLTELANASMCHKLMCKRFGEKARISLDFIREIHATMMAGCYDKRRFIELDERPGEFKKHDFIVGKDEVGSDPEYVVEDLHSLLCELYELGAKDPLTAGAYFHVNFECIHPFADGNGRVGRLLLNYWLVLNNYPPVTVYNEDKQRYFDALQAYVETEDLTPLCTFLEEQTIKTWSSYLG